MTENLLQLQEFQLLNPKDPRRGRVLLVSLNIPGYYCLATRLLALITARTEALAQRFEPYYIDGNVNTSPKELAAWVKALQPDLIGFSVNIWNRNPTFEIAREIKQLIPNTTLIAGGQEVTHSVIDYLGQINELDYIIDGEGEIPWSHFLTAWNLQTRTLTNPEQVPGLWYRQGGQSLFSGPGGHIASLDELPSPILEGLVPWDPGFKLGIMIEGARGCPFRCSFCFEGAKKGKVRLASLNRIIQEIEFMANRGANYFHLLDPILGNGDPARIGAITQTFHRLREKDERIRVSLEMHPDELRPELVECLADFFIIDVGLQTINPEANRAIHRRFDAQKFTQNINLLKKARANFNIYLIAGLPYETLASCLQGILFVIGQKPTHLFVNELCLLNGTELRWDAEKYGYEFDSNPPYIVRSSRWMSRRDLRILQTCSKFISLFFNYAYTGVISNAPWLHENQNQTQKWLKVPLPGPCVFQCPGCLAKDDSGMATEGLKKLLDEAAGQNVEFLTPYPLNVTKLSSLVAQFSLAGAARLKLTTPPENLIDRDLLRRLIKWGIWYFQTFFQGPNTIQALENLNQEFQLRKERTFRPIMEVRLRPESQGFGTYQEQAQQVIRPSRLVITLPEGREEDEALKEMAGIIFEKAIWSDCWVKMPSGLLGGAIGPRPDLEEIVNSLEKLELTSHESEEPPCFRKDKK
jgi:radical SAM superfamily enzyme YgiQ (UPF0313 family)